MLKVKIEIPKEVENVFSEFESFFGGAVRYAEESCVIYDVVEINGEPICIPKETESPTVNVIKRNKCLDNYFKGVIAELVDHLVNQLSDYDAGKLGTFILKNRTFQQKYLPDNRKQILYEIFVYNLYSGYYYVHNVKINEVTLDTNETKFAKYLFDQYCRFYKKLTSDLRRIEEIYLRAKPAELQNKKVNMPSSDAIALFCKLINDTDISIKRNEESASSYCKRICEAYNLKYADRVRQVFYSNKTKKHYRQMIDFILPLIDNGTQSTIKKYLDNNTASTKNLYG